MDRGLTILIAASLAGMLAMAWVAQHVGPARVPLRDLDGHVGTTVRTEGRVLQLRTHETGWTRFLLADENVSVPATTDGPPGASPGDWVEATGQVARYGSALQLDVTTPKDVSVLVPWRASHVPLGNVLRAPWAYRDAPLRTLGVLELERNAAYLADPTGAGRLPASGPSPWPVAPGSLAAVDAELRYDELSGRYRLAVLSAEPAAPPG